MGDRANFGFRQADGNTIVLYGHWAGYEMLAKLAHAVSAAETRWDDESYATRIAVSQLVGSEWNETTGWGLSINTIMDNEHKVPIIDWSTRTFSLHEEAPWSESTEYKIKGIQDEPIFTMTFQSFIDKYSRVLV